MTTLKKRKTDIAQIKESTKETPISDISFTPNKGNFDLVVSTGSTLLDLAISGDKKEEGGIPGGILLELFGQSGGGKTALLSEICSSAQKRGGEVKFADPEARLDKEYTKIYGVNIKKDFFDYSMPDTVSEVFDLIWNWQPKNNNAINIFAGDSIAAFSTDMEMENEDKMGMRRAKEFSAGLRKTCRIIRNNNWIIAFTNQLRQDQSGYTTPGGMGIPYHASLRIQVAPAYKGHKIKKEVTLPSGTKVGKVIGVNSVCTIVKSSVGSPYRTAPICIVFNYGIDDIMANLQYCKDMKKNTKYNAITKEFLSMEKAITHIEDNDLANDLKKETIVLWKEIQELFNVNRKKKER